MQPTGPIVVRPWPEWLPLAEAADYARMSRDKLLQLVAAGKVVGYRNQEFRRGPKGGGEWWINRASIDSYHDELAGAGPVGRAVLETRKRLGL